MKKLYLNWRGPAGRETVDEFTRGEDSPADWRGFRRYVGQMVAEYRIAGMDVYTSGRACANWRA